MLLFENYSDVGLLILRVVIGVVFLYHGFPKIFNNSTSSKSMGMSVAFVYLVGLFEMVGGLSVLLGLYTEIGAILISIIMLGAMQKKIFVWHVPFSKGGVMGWEFDLTLLAGALALLLIGAGSISIDALIGIWP